MPGPPPPRKQVDLNSWPPLWRWTAVVVTIAVVVAAALLFGKPAEGVRGWGAAIVAALIAFAFVAWRRQRH